MNAKVSSSVHAQKLTTMLSGILEWIHKSLLINIKYSKNFCQSLVLLDQHQFSKIWLSCFKTTKLYKTWFILKKSDSRMNNWRMGDKYRTRIAKNTLSKYERSYKECMYCLESTKHWHGFPNFQVSAWLLKATGWSCSLFQYIWAITQVESLLSLLELRLEICLSHMSR